MIGRGTSYDMGGIGLEGSSRKGLMQIISNFDKV